MPSLSDFRADAPQPLIEVLAEEDQLPIVFQGKMLAFDQSLGDGGWALLIFGEGVEVRRTGNIRTTSEEKGHRANIARSVQFFHAVEDLLREFDPHLVAFESPPAAGGKMRYPESSLMSAEALCISASLNDVPTTMVHSQKVKKRLTGNGNAKKKLVAGEVKRRMPELLEQRPGPLNEAVYDAIGVGLVAGAEIENKEALDGQ